jgi:hypothetical protein
MHVICGCRCGHWQYVDLPARAVTLACKNMFCCIWSIPKGWFLWNYGLGEQTILLIHCWSGYFWNLCLAISFLQGLQDQTCVKTMSTKRLRGLRWSCFKDHVPFVSGFRKVGRFPYILRIINSFVTAEFLTHIHLMWMTRLDPTHEHLVAMTVITWGLDRIWSMNDPCWVQPGPPATAPFKDPMNGQRLYIYGRQRSRESF